MEEKAPETMEEEYNPDGARRQKWAAYVESALVNFFIESKLEKLTVEDGNGNKAKLNRTKDDGIKMEYSSTTII